MSSLYLRRLSQNERQQLIDKLLSAQSGHCFICGGEIHRELHGRDIEIDHIEPLKVGGRDAPENLAATHAACNNSKLASDLRVARLLAEFRDIAKSAENDGRAPNLGDVLSRRGGCQYKLPVVKEGSSIKVSFPEIGETDVVTLPIHEDKISGFVSSFVEMPIEYLHHDTRINPRGIGKNLRGLVEEFHKKRPQLHVALAWLSLADGPPCKVSVFDGQHKAAAQILLGAKSLPVRIFVDPDEDVLLTTNTNAGTRLRQVAFDKSVQRSLGSSLLRERMDQYRKDTGKGPEDASFSEQDLVNHFKGERREVNRYVLDWVRNGVTTHHENKLHDYIDPAGKGHQKPLSYSTIEKTFYSLFIGSDLLKTPLNYKEEEGANPRLLEVEQIVKLMNIVADEIYVGKFDPGLGTNRIEHKVKKGEDIPPFHLRAFRMSKEEIIHNWLRYVRQIITTYFGMVGEPIEEGTLFQSQIPEVCWERIANFVAAMGKLPMWVNKDLSSSAFSGKQDQSYWQSVFRTGTATDGTVVMSDGINLMEMIKQPGG